MNTMVRGLIGAAIGGAIGYFAFHWITRQGFYGLVLPGAFLGIGARLCARDGSTPLAIVCAVTSFLLGLFAEWRFAPFVADRSLAYFITHIHQLRPITLIMIAVGAGLSFWLSFRPTGTMIGNR